VLLGDTLATLASGTLIFAEDSIRQLRLFLKRRRHEMQREEGDRIEWSDRRRETG
jgi:hypothetical protein